MVHGIHIFAISNQATHGVGSLLLELNDAPAEKEHALIPSIKTHQLSFDQKNTKGTLNKTRKSWVNTCVPSKLKNLKILNKGLEQIHHRE